MATETHSIAACPSPIQVLHAAFEDAWVVYDRVDCAELRSKRACDGPNPTMQALAVKAERLELAILETAISSNDDLAVLLTHLVMAVDANLAPTLARSEAIERATETALAFTLRSASVPHGRNSKICCDNAIATTDRFMVGSMTQEDA